MANVVLISCSATKDELSKQQPMEAKDIYKGQLFQKSYRYAELKYKDNPIFILSAKYGLLEPSEKIPYYNQYLGDFSKDQLEKWGTAVIHGLDNKNISRTLPEYVGLAGKKYIDPIKTSIKKWILPLEGKGGIGFQLGWLTQEIEALEKSLGFFGKLKQKWKNYGTHKSSGKVTDKELSTKIKNHLIECINWDKSNIEPKNIGYVYPNGVKKNTTPENDTLVTFKGLSKLKTYVVEVDSNKWKSQYHLLEDIKNISTHYNITIEFK